MTSNEWMFWLGLVAVILCLSTLAAYYDVVAALLGGVAMLTGIIVDRAR